MRIAVIGSGISGIAAAHFLSPKHDVTLFEAAARLGGHTNTVRLDLPDETHHVDTGFIVHNRVNYPVFCSLLDAWGVQTQESEMSFSVSCARTGLEFAGTGPGGLFAQRRNAVRPGYWRLLGEIARFGVVGRRFLAAVPDAPGDPTTAELLVEHGFSRTFVDSYLVPLGSAIWSADPSGFDRFPAQALLRFLDNHGLLTLVKRPAWRTVTGGSQRYVDAALRNMRIDVRLASPVQKLQRDADGVDVLTDRGTERFDAVVSAVHSDQALRMLADPTAAEVEVLGAVRYQRNIAVLHTDERLLPASRRAWAAWNYHRPAVDRDLPTVTYLMNRLQRLDSSRQICVTLNRENEIRSDRVHATIEYHHPVYDHAAFAAQRRWDDVNGTRRTWFCGAWWGYGFHEDGAASARRVALALGARC